MDPHITEITNVIHLAVAPVFMLTAVGTIIAALNMRRDFPGSLDSPPRPEVA